MIFHLGFEICESLANDFHISQWLISVEKRFDLVFRLLLTLVCFHRETTEQTQTHTPIFKTLPLMAHKTDLNNKIIAPFKNPDRLMSSLSFPIIFPLLVFFPIHSSTLKSLTGCLKVAVFTCSFFPIFHTFFSHSLIPL